MLRWLKTVVVSDVEKAHGMRQVGIGKTVRSPRFRGSLWTCRYSIRWHQNRGVVGQPGMSLAGVRFSWPGGVRHVGDVSPVCGFCMERGKACPDTAVRLVAEGEREPAKRLNRKAVSTARGAPADRLVVAGKPLLSAVGVEPRGRVIRGLFVRSTGSMLPGGVGWTG